MSDDTPDDFDSPWKEALEQALPDFLALFFPEAYAGIDWSQGFRFCDTELQQVVRDAVARLLDTHSDRDPEARLFAGVVPGVGLGSSGYTKVLR